MSLFTVFTSLSFPTAAIGAGIQMKKMMKKFKSKVPHQFGKHGMPSCYGS